MSDIEMALHRSLGMKASTTAIVNSSNTAREVGSGGLDVFSTPTMIALMEQAACLCLRDCLPEGQTSVGIFIQVEHTAASPLGAEITATATIESASERTIEFSLAARDNTGPIGQGRHTRAIVQTDRFMDRTRMRHQTVLPVTDPCQEKGDTQNR